MNNISCGNPNNFANCSAAGASPPPYDGFRRVSVGGGFSAPAILEQNCIAIGDPLALPTGELSPKVTERANTLSGPAALGHRPQRGRQDGFMVSVYPKRFVNFAQNVPDPFGYIVFLYPNTVKNDTLTVKINIYLIGNMLYNTRVLISA